jgi:hypothetical protein
MGRGRGKEGNECPVRELETRKNGDTHWCSREESVVLYSKAGEYMGRGRGQEGNECPVRKTLGRMV